MSFILTLIICSYTAGTCLPPYQWPQTFPDAYSCMIAGNEQSIAKFKQLGVKPVNKHRMYIKFICTERKENCVMTKKKITTKDYSNMVTAVRLSSHEKLCAEKNETIDKISR